MEKHTQLFSAGQFARLHSINKRTLHYYDDIGLFSPAYKGENGYRYYTYFQSATLEMLLTLRELDMSIEEIAEYMKNRSANAFHKIIAEKTIEIDKNIKRLKKIRKLIANKQAQLYTCEQAALDHIQIVEQAKEYLLLSRPITGIYGEADFAVLLDHSQEMCDHRMFNKSYGSMISAEKIMKNKFDEYDCFFTKVEPQNYKAGLFVKPAGTYIKAFCKGNWDKLPDTYCRIIDFAAEHGLILSGYAYEEGINEIAITSMEEYVTMIMMYAPALESKEGK